MSIPASNKLISQSLTVSLPYAHTSLQITPHIPVALTQRPYRIFVTVNGQRMTEVVRQGVAVSNDRSRPIYEGRLERGTVNRIEVEVLAAKELGRSSTGAGGLREAKEGVDMERCTVFVHLLRA